MKYIIGVDEAGRGPWLGPVSACALCFSVDNPPHQEFINRLNDSKKLSEKRRDALYGELIEMSRGDNPQIFFGVGLVDNFVIDEINIKQANREAMRRGLVELLRKIGSLGPALSPHERKGARIEVLIDGRDNYEFEELTNQPTYIVGGDGKVSEIGAASIIAKVFRDKILYQYATLYPDLGLENHKGYGTKKHRETLQTQSDIIGIHRISYRPVKKIMEG